MHLCDYSYGWTIRISKRLKRRMFILSYKRRRAWVRYTCVRMANMQLGFTRYYGE